MRHSVDAGRPLQYLGVRTTSTPRHSLRELPTYSPVAVLAAGRSSSSSSSSCSSDDESDDACESRPHQRVAARADEIVSAFDELQENALNDVIDDVMHTNDVIDVAVTAREPADSDCRHSCSSASADQSRGNPSVVGLQDHSSAADVSSRRLTGVEAAITTTTSPFVEKCDDDHAAADHCCDRRIVWAAREDQQQQEQQQLQQQQAKRNEESAGKNDDRPVLDLSLPRRDKRLS